METDSRSVGEDELCAVHAEDETFEFVVDDADDGKTVVAVVHHRLAGFLESKSLPADTVQTNGCRIFCDGFLLRTKEQRASVARLGSLIMVQVPSRHSMWYESRKLTLPDIDPGELLQQLEAMEEFRANTTTFLCLAMLLAWLGSHHKSMLLWKKYFWPMWRMHADERWRQLRAHPSCKYATLKHFFEAEFGFEPLPWNVRKTRSMSPKYGSVTPAHAGALQLFKVCVIPMLNVVARNPSPKHFIESYPSCARLLEDATCAWSRSAGSRAYALFEAVYRAVGMPSDGTSLATQLASVKRLCGQWKKLLSRHSRALAAGFTKEPLVGRAARAMEITLDVCDRLRITLSELSLLDRRAGINGRDALTQLRKSTVSSKRKAKGVPRAIRYTFPHWCNVIQPMARAMSLFLAEASHHLDGDLNMSEALWEMCSELEPTAADALEQVERWRHMTIQDFITEVMQLRSEVERLTQAAAFRGDVSEDKESTTEELAAVRKALAAEREAHAKEVRELRAELRRLRAQAASGGGGGIGIGVGDDDDKLDSDGNHMNGADNHVVTSESSIVTLEDDVARDRKDMLTLTGHELINAIHQSFSTYNDPSAVRRQEMLNRAIRIIAKDIYSSVDRFALELIQNADDNVFDAANEDACVSISLTDTYAWIEINEKGFSAKDVLAVCDVGASTKNVEHQTGRKGIGFKACFSVADQVYIFSNGYNFMLSSLSRQAFVDPVWVDTHANVFPRDIAGHGTTFYLPFKEDLDVGVEIRPVAFVDQCDFLLLFLRRVEALRINVALNDRLHVTKECKVMRKATQHDRVTAVTLTIETTNAGSHAAAATTTTTLPTLTSIASPSMDGVSRTLQYHLYEHECPVPECLREEAGLENTKVVLGFAFDPKLDGPDAKALLGAGADAATADDLDMVLDDDADDTWARSGGMVSHEADAAASQEDSDEGMHALDADEQQRRQQRQLAQGELLYAFLPVKRMGLPFALQADWRLVSSREDIHENDSFNLWLRSVAVDAFVDAVDAIPHVKARLEAFLPVESRLSDFWQDMARDIRTRLSNLPCVLLDYMDRRVYVEPGLALYCPPSLRGLLTSDQVEPITGKRFVHPSISAAVARAKFGCATLTLTALFACISTMPEPVIRSQPPQWFSRVYALMSNWMQRHAKESADAVAAFHPGTQVSMTTSGTGIITTTTTANDEVPEEDNDETESHVIVTHVREFPIRNMAVFRLMDDTWTSLGAGTLNVLPSDKEWQLHLCDLRLLHPDTVALVNTATWSCLGVSVVAEERIVSYILRYHTMASEHMDSANRTALAAQLAYLARHHSRDESLCARLGPLLLLPSTSFAQSGDGASSDSAATFVKGVTPLKQCYAYRAAKMFHEYGVHVQALDMSLFEDLDCSASMLLVWLERCGLRRIPVFKASYAFASAAPTKEGAKVDQPSESSLGPGVGDVSDVEVPNAEGPAVDAGDVVRHARATDSDWKQLWKALHVKGTDATTFVEFMDAHWNHGFAAVADELCPLVRKLHVTVTKPVCGLGGPWPKTLPLDLVVIRPKGSEAAWGRQRGSAVTDLLRWLPMASPRLCFIRSHLASRLRIHREWTQDAVYTVHQWLSGPPPAKGEWKPRCRVPAVWKSLYAQARTLGFRPLHIAMWNPNVLFDDREVQEAAMRTLATCVWELPPSLSPDDVGVFAVSPCYGPQLRTTFVKSFHVPLRLDLERLAALTFKTNDIFLDSSSRRKTFDAKLPVLEAVFDEMELQLAAQKGTRCPDFLLVTEACLMMGKRKAVEQGVLIPSSTPCIGESSRRPLTVMEAFSGFENVYFLHNIMTIERYPNLLSSTPLPKALDRLKSMPALKRCELRWDREVAAMWAYPLVWLLAEQSHSVDVEAVRDRLHRLQVLIDVNSSRFLSWNYCLHDGVRTLKQEWAWDDELCVLVLSGNLAQRPVLHWPALKKVLPGELAEVHKNTVYWKPPKLAAEVTERNVADGLAQPNVHDLMAYWSQMQQYCASVVDGFIKPEPKAPNPVGNVPSFGRGKEGKRAGESGGSGEGTGSGEPGRSDSNPGASDLDFPPLPAAHQASSASDQGKPTSSAAKGSPDRASNGTAASATSDSGRGMDTVDICDQYRCAWDVQVPGDVTNARQLLQGIQSSSEGSSRAMAQTLWKRVAKGKCFPSVMKEDLNQLTSEDRARRAVREAKRRGQEAEVSFGEILALESEFKDVIGAVGERFAYECLCRSHGRNNVRWISSFNTKNGPKDDTAGYDIEFTDPNCPYLTILVEVKTHLYAAQSTFMMSGNEWRRCLKAHATKSEVYGVMRVSLRPTPTIVEWILFPTHCTGPVHKRHNCAYNMEPKSYLISPNPYHQE